MRFGEGLALILDVSFFLKKKKEGEEGSWGINLMTFDAVKTWLNFFEFKCPTLIHWPHITCRLAAILTLALS